MCDIAKLMLLRIALCSFVTLQLCRFADLDLYSSLDRPYIILKISHAYTHVTFEHIAQIALIRKIKVCGHIAFLFIFPKLLLHLKELCLIIILIGRNSSILFEYSDEMIF